jgi:hypothetical protein|tara:strand:+ start:1973 stop:2323 length:351 start_codon:yes stop_codon:yes gene_type:complete
MPILTFTFAQELNVSIQVGDVAYYVPTNTSSQFQVNSSDIIEIGPVASVTLTSFSSNTNLPASSYPSASDYIFFTKDNKANQSSVLGYYAKVQLKNNSKDEAEIFNVSADAFDSSK